MKTTKTSLSIATVLFAGLLTLNACKKDKETTPTPATPAANNEQTTATDNNMAENIVNDMDAMASQAFDNGGLITFRTDGSAANLLTLASCAAVSASNNVVTVDFGSGCYGNDGRTRSGKLIYTLSASTPAGATHYRNPGFSVDVSSQNYVVDSVHVTIISKNIINTTPANIPQTATPTVNLTWAITASVSITKANGTTFTWGCNRSKELTNTNDPACYHGQLQPIDWSAAIIKLNGNSSGTNALNETFSATITNLVRKFPCSPVIARPGYHPFISGTITYTPGTRPVRLIDFGTGTCDNNATVTINNQSYPIVLF